MHIQTVSTICRIIASIVGVYSIKFGYDKLSVSIHFNDIHKYFPNLDDIYEFIYFVFPPINSYLKLHDSV